MGSTYSALAAETTIAINPDVLGHDGTLLVQGHVLLELLNVSVVVPTKWPIRTHVGVVGDDSSVLLEW